MSVRFAIAGSILFMAEIVVLLSYAASPDAVAGGQPHEPVQQDAQSGQPIQLAQAAPRTDGDVLAHCMNGQAIALDDGEVMTCHIRRTRR